MRELVYFVATSIDGLIASPTGDFAAFLAEGDHFDVIFSDWIDALPKIALDALELQARGDVFSVALMGWNSYAAGMPATDNPYPHLAQYVFSKTPLLKSVPPGVTVPGVTVTDNDPVEVVRELKKQPGSDIWLVGGGQLAGSLADEIDRIVLKINPLFFGSGIPLFSGNSYNPTVFELCASQAFKSGVVINDYRRKR